MELISDFVMPPFARIQWANKRVKDKYEPMFKKAQRFFSIMEKESVKHGLRTTTTAHVKPHDLIKAQRDYLKDGLAFYPIRRVGEYKGMSAFHPKPQPNQPWSYYGVVSSNVEDANTFLKSEIEGQRVDHKPIGKVLGYPDCCVDTFTDYFNSKIVDGVWDRAIKTGKDHVRSHEGNVITLKNVNWKLNNLLRGFHLMVLFHAPCSYDCANSINIAESWVALGKELGVEGLAELELFLSLPYEWDCYKGIAYLRTPLFKCSTNSNFSTERYQVRIEGTYFPEDAPNGTSFPHDMGTRFATVARKGNKLEFGGHELGTN